MKGKQYDSIMWHEMNWKKDEKEFYWRIGIYSLLMIQIGIWIGIELLNIFIWF